MKRKPTKWEKIFANEAIDKELIYKVHKQYIQLNIKKKSKNGCKIQTFLQRRHTDGQNSHGKMFNITNYQRNANQNYDEVSPHTDQNGHHQKIYKQ